MKCECKIPSYGSAYECRECGGDIRIKKGEDGLPEVIDTPPMPSVKDPKPDRSQRAKEWDDLVEKELAAPLLRKEVISIQPGDAIVVSMQETLSIQASENVKGMLGEVFPDTKALVLDGGMTLEVYRERKHADIDCNLFNANCGESLCPNGDPDNCLYREQDLKMVDGRETDTEQIKTVFRPHPEDREYRQGLCQKCDDWPCDANHICSKLNREQEKPYQTSKENGILKPTDQSTCEADCHHCPIDECDYRRHMYDIGDSREQEKV